MIGIFFIKMRKIILYSNHIDDTDYMIMGIFETTHNFHQQIFLLNSRLT